MKCYWCGQPITADATQRRGYRHSGPEWTDTRLPLPQSTLRAGCLTMASPSANTFDSTPFGPWPVKVA